jgi:hypothetical protein
MKVIVLLALLCPSTTATSCDSGSCERVEDETSLMQLKTSIHKSEGGPDCKCADSDFKCLKDCWESYADADKSGSAQPPAAKVSSPKTPAAHTVAAPAPEVPAADVLQPGEAWGKTIFPCRAKAWQTGFEVFEKCYDPAFLSTRENPDSKEGEAPLLESVNPTGDFCEKRERARFDGRCPSVAANGKWEMANGKWQKNGCRVQPQRWLCNVPEQRW